MQIQLRDFSFVGGFLPGQVEIEVTASSQYKERWDARMNIISG